MCGTGVCARWRCIVTVLRLLYDDDLRLLLLLRRRVSGRSRRGNAELRAQAFSRVSAASHDEEHNQGDAEDDATDGDAGFGAVGQGGGAGGRRGTSPAPFRFIHIIHSSTATVTP